MEETILKTFFEKNMPLHQPLDDRFLKTLDDENLLKRDFRYLFSVEEMIRISYRLENFLISMPGHCDAHVSFQYMSRFKTQELRYESVANAAKNLWVYGATDIEIPNLPRTRFIDTTATQLVNYWFIILHGTGMSGTLLAVDTAALSTDRRIRRFDGFYTFDPMIPLQLTSILHQYFPADVPSPLIGT